MMRLAPLVVTVLVVAGTPAARGQNAGELAALKARLDQMEAKLKSAEKEIADLKNEVEQLKKDAGSQKVKADPKKPAADAFAVGAIFEGTRTTTASGQVLDITIVVTKRDGMQFEADLTAVDKADKSTVTRKLKGTAPTDKGTVLFDSEKTGLQKQSYTGQFSNGELGFKFSGTSITGGSISGIGLVKAK